MFEANTIKVNLLNEEASKYYRWTTEMVKKMRQLLGV